jgi:WD40 repeat protein
LGKSGVGRTWLAIEIQTPSRIVVIKQQWQTHSALPSDLQHRLNLHPQIPALLDTFVEAGYSYRVEAYVPGDNLTIVLTQKATFSPLEVWTVLQQILPVLAFVQEMGIMHGDIKPENLILKKNSSQSDVATLGITVDPSQSLLLVDWNAAQRILPDLPIAIPTGAGNPAYAAPEQLQGHPTLNSDLYSLGVTGLHLLTGIDPPDLFDYHENRWIWRDYWLPDNQGSSLAQDLATILDQLVEPLPARRFASATVAIATLQSLAKTRGQKVVVPPPPPAPTWECYATLNAHRGLFATINAIALSPNSQTLASASDDQTIRLWKKQTNQPPTFVPVTVLRGHQNFVKTLAFHPQQSTLLASAGSDRVIHLWDLQTQEISRTLAGHQQQINALSFQPDGTILASGSNDKTLKLWQWETGALLATLTDHYLGINAIAFSPTQPLLATASGDSRVNLWDLTNGDLLESLEAHTASVDALTFSPDGKVLATAGHDRTILLWETDRWQLIQTLSGHTWPISALRFFSDSTHLVSSSWDTTIKIWNILKGETIAVLKGHTDSVQTLAVCQEILITGGADKTIKFWSLKKQR